MKISIFLLFCILIAIYYIRPNRVAICIDNRKWNVIDNYENKVEAAQLLARVNASMIELMRSLKKKYHIDETDDLIAREGDAHYRIVHLPNDLYNIVDYLLNNYNPDVFYENDPRTSTDTSYTINKGTAMYICLRQKENPNKFVDESTLLFVLLHEASHIAYYNGWGHNIGFWAIFKFILHEAVLAGIYKPTDYAKYPTNYCGLDILYNPLFDSEIENIWA